MAVVLAVTLSVTVVAGGTRDVCEIGNFSHKLGDTNLDNGVTSGDITMTIKRIFTQVVDLEVTSDGCCPIEVSWTAGGGGGGTVAPGDTVIFYNILKDCNVSVSANDTDPSCAFDSWSDAGAQTHDVTMDSNKCVTATCYKAYPEPCCWCIYETEWWALPNAPPADPTSKEYIAWHCDLLLDPGHTENPPGYPEIVIPDASYHQTLSAFAGPVPNGYGLDEWDVLVVANDTLPSTYPGVSRTNPDLGGVLVHGYEYWISQYSRINWKSRYDLDIPIEPWHISIYSWTVSVIPLVGNAGFPYATGNMWGSIIVSGITDPTLYLAVVGEEEMIDCGGAIPPLQCFKNESFIWDDDGDWEPEEGELTPSGTNYVTNAYACPIKVDTAPGQLYDGWENRCLIWFCQDPPFPPWAP